MSCPKSRRRLQSRDVDQETVTHGGKELTPLAALVVGRVIVMQT